MKKALDLIKNLEGKGVQFEPRGERIWISSKDLPAETMDTIQAGRQEALWFLRTRLYTKLRTQAEKLASYLDDTSVPLPDREQKLPGYEDLVGRISELQLFIDHYQASGLDRWYSQGWLLIHSDLLGEMIVLIRDPEVKLPESARVYPIYQFSEVQVLDGKSDEIVRAAYMTKKTFNGKIEASGGVKK